MRQKRMRYSKNDIEKVQLKNIVIPLLVIGLVSVGIITATVGFVGKDLVYQINIDPEQFSSFSRIDLFYTRNNQNYSIKADFTDGNTNGRIPKDIQLQSVRATKNTDLGMTIDTKDETIIAQNFTFETSQNMSNLEYESNRSSYYNASSGAIGVSNHYKGSESFFCGDVVGQSPNDWSASGVIIASTYQSHDKVANVQGNGRMERQLNDWKSQGTIEFWYQTSKYVKNSIIRFGNNSFYGFAIGMKARTGISGSGDLCLYSDLISFHDNSTAIANTLILKEKNYIIRADFNTDTGRFDIYLNETMIYRDEKMESNPNAIGWIQFFNQDASESFYIDAMGWTWGNEEISGLQYTILMNKQRWGNYIYTFKYYIGAWLRSYKHVSNLTLDYQFVFLQCTNTSNPSAQLYNYCSSSYTTIQNPVINNTNYNYTPSLAINYFNKTSESWTNIQLQLSVNYIGMFNHQLSVNATTGFWKQISEFEYNETNLFESSVNTTIMTGTPLYTETNITQIVNITSIISYSYGSWSYQIISSSIITIVYIQEYAIFLINAEKQDVLSNSNWGTQGLKITIYSLDMKDQRMDADFDYKALWLY